MVKVDIQSAKEVHPKAKPSTDLGRDGDLAGEFCPSGTSVVSKAHWIAVQHTRSLVVQLSTGSQERQIGVDIRAVR